MLVKELLDKQHEWTHIILTNEGYDCKWCGSANRMHAYITDLEDYRNKIYDECGDREVEYFSHFINKNNKIIMLIQLAENRT